MSTFSKCLSIIGAAVLLILIAAGCLTSKYNTAVGNEERVHDAYSCIGVTLTNRFNKLNELAQCVKQYDEHEYRTLKATIEARGANMSHDEAKQCMLQIAAVAEQYPQLQSQKNYQMLMVETSLIENKVAQVKGAYNDAVRKYNTYCRGFITSIVLDVFGYEKKKFEYYESSPDVDDTKPIKMF